MTSPSHDSQDPRAYFIIRDVASELAGVFEDLRFEPLFKRRPGTVSVVALLPGDYVAEEQDTWLTMWRGHREGGGQDEIGHRLWLRIDRLADRRSDDWIQTVDPDAPSFGLELPDLAGDGDSLLEGVSGMVKLLETAAPVHGSNSDTDLVFQALNDSLREGIAHGGRQGGSHVLDEEEDPVAELVQLCAESGLESVDFGPYAATGQKPFATSAVLDLADQVQMTVWSDSEGVDWIDVAGHVQRMDMQYLHFPGENQQEADMVSQLAVQLAAIHNVPEAIFRNLDPQMPDTAFELLNTVAFMAMNGGMEEPDLSITPWHAWADHFSAHCRLGFLAGVMLEESPFGNLNIGATTMDPVTRRSRTCRSTGSRMTRATFPSTGSRLGPQRVRPTTLTPSTRSCWPASRRAAASISGTPLPTCMRWCTWRGPFWRPGPRKPRISWTPGKRWRPSRMRWSTR